MAEKNRLQIVMEKPAEKSACIFIGQMSSVPQNSLFQIIRVFPHLKHSDIMIRLQKQRIQMLKIFHNILVIFSKVRCDSHRLLSAFQTISHRMGGIMRDAKGIDPKIFDKKGSSSRISRKIPSGIFPRELIRDMASPVPPVA